MPTENETWPGNLDGQLTSPRPTKNSVEHQNNFLGLLEGSQIRSLWGIHNERFYKRSGKWCSSCDYLPVCGGNQKKATETLVQIK